MTTHHRRKESLPSSRTPTINQEITFTPTDGLVGVSVSNNFHEVNARHDESAVKSN